MQRPIEERIIDAACIYWGIDRAYFEKGKLDADVTYRKAIIYYLLKKHTTYSLNRIASFFGFKSHQAVGRLIENLEATKNVFKQHKEDILQIEKMAEQLTALTVAVEVKMISCK